MDDYSPTTYGTTNSTGQPMWAVERGPRPTAAQAVRAVAFVAAGLLLVAAVAATVVYGILLVA